MVCVETGIPPEMGVPLHVHAHEHETFFVLRGRLRFFGDDMEEGGVVVEPGGGMHGPHGRRHGFPCEGPTPAAMLVVGGPGRPTEELSAEIAQTDVRQAFAASAEQVAEACGRYGISFG